MEILIYIGATTSAVGLIGLLYCIFLALKAKRLAGDEEAMRAQLQKIVPLNMGALFLSILGLMMVVIGVLL
jgi:hypothetical protein